jgi:hypothetical protein
MTRNMALKSKGPARQIHLYTVPKPESHPHSELAFGTFLAKELQTLKGLAVRQASRKSY